MASSRIFFCVGGLEAHNIQEQTTNIYMANTNVFSERGSKPWPPTRQPARANARQEVT